MRRRRPRPQPRVRRARPGNRRQPPARLLRRLHAERGPPVTSEEGYDSVVPTPSEQGNLDQAQELIDAVNASLEERGSPKRYNILSDSDPRRRKNRKQGPVTL